MAVYRLHKREWEKNSRPLNLPTSKSTLSSSMSNKRKGTVDTSESESDFDNDEEAKNLAKPPVTNTSISATTKGKMKATSNFPGGGRKGVSSGLSTVIRRSGSNAKGAHGGEKTPKAKSEWWKQLPGSVSSANGSKGSITVTKPR